MDFKDFMRSSGPLYLKSENGVLHIHGTTWVKNHPGQTAYEIKGLPDHIIKMILAGIVITKEEYDSY